jgi:hypothetical protein
VPKCTDTGPPLVCSGPLPFAWGCVCLPCHVTESRAQCALSWTVPRTCHVPRPVTTTRAEPSPRTVDSRTWQLLVCQCVPFVAPHRQPWLPRSQRGGRCQRRESHAILVWLWGLWSRCAGTSWLLKFQAQELINLCVSLGPPNVSSVYHQQPDDVLAAGTGQTESRSYLLLTLKKHMHSS